ncbi:Bug family tripartite tricarboxylate transporter substrate binding protein [Oligella urethralis]|uniref:Bug family tripartite tricarboxylate transporter substrate binding protein n=1 Tax=Oligella urethralis TaxID=90245 RepID=UPI000DFA3A75|nr:tripartite tricarboxylate transporter substrate binding protein [Oligella urethralis]SUA56879.1 Tripartite tricarboxylate transporter family receptor [Oligella urethralis]
MRLAKKLSTLLLASGLLFAANAVQAQEPNRPECIAPAQPGGGFDLTCRIAVNSFQNSDLLKNPMRTVYMPGGIGAVAYNNIVAQRRNDPNAIVAFSGGSLLNLAQGKFGRYGVDDVRWLASVGADYGALMVRQDSPFKNLDDLIKALKADPSKVVFGAGGSVGSQDWMVVALTAKAAEVDYKKIRFVAFEGGGEAATALTGNHVQVLSTGAAETVGAIEGGSDMRVLAVFSEDRLPGVLEDVPTAKELGYDIVWSIVRGFYVGPDVSDEQYDWWVNAFNQLYKTDTFKEIQKQQGLFSHDVAGKELDSYVKQRVKEYAELAESFGLMK